jgi:hypothetical protein
MDDPTFNTVLEDAEHLQHLVTLVNFSVSEKKVILFSHWFKSEQERWWAVGLLIKGEAYPPPPTYMIKTETTKPKKFVSSSRINFYLLKSGSTELYVILEQEYRFNRKKRINQEARAYKPLLLRLFWILSLLLSL